MVKNYSQLLIGIIIGLVAGLLIARVVFVGGSAPTPSSDQSKQSDGSRRNNDDSRQPQSRQNDPPQQNRTGDSLIPQKVYDVLKYIKANNGPMDGYVGGREFRNRERQLPERDTGGKPIDYQEWDVHPKIEGQNRGTERIVTGSDGRSWYTRDHYRTFMEIK
jgi:guanyl-specific ribonuclease Sa